MLRHCTMSFTARWGEVVVHASWVKSHGWLIKIDCDVCFAVLVSSTYCKASWVNLSYSRAQRSKLSLYNEGGGERLTGLLYFALVTLPSSVLKSCGSDMKRCTVVAVHCLLSWFPANLMWHDTRHIVVANNAAPHWLFANLLLWEVIGQAICSVGGIKAEIKQRECVGAGILRVSTGPSLPLC